MNTKLIYKGFYITIFSFILFFSMNCSIEQNTEKRTEPVQRKVVSPGSSSSLFFVRDDTVFYYYFKKGLYRQLSTYEMQFEPNGWSNYQKMVFEEKKLLSQGNPSIQSADLYFTENVSARIYDGRSSKEIILIQLRVQHRGFNNWDVRGLAKFPAHFYNYKKNAITLTNGFEAKVNKFSIPLSNNFKNGIPITVFRRDSVGNKFGETVYEQKTVNIATLHDINLTDLDFLCFGTNGLVALSNKLNKDIYTTKIPFRYLLKPRSISPSASAQD